MPDTTSDLIGMIQRQPSNPNFLNSHRFRLALHRIPNVIYFMQEINLPGMSMGNATQPTPFVDMPIYGDKIQFGDLTLSFAVDEDMKNYKEIWNWIVEVGFPQSFDQHKDLRKNAHMSDMLLMILNSNYNPQHYIMFRAAFPTSIGDLQFNVKDQDTQVQTCSVTFKYAYYQFLDMENIVP